MIAHPTHNPRLDTDRQPHEAQHYTHVRTLAEKFRVPERLIDGIQARYAEAYNNSGLYISRRDEIPGYRRVVLLDPLWSRSKKPEFTLFMVNEKGLMSSRSFPKSRFGGRYPSVLELLSTGSERQPAEAIPLLEMNRFSAAYRDAQLLMLHNLSAGAVFKEEPVRDPSSEKYVKKTEEQINAEIAERASLHRLSAAMRSMARSRIFQSYGLACHALMEALDPEISRIMRSAQCTATNVALWLSGEDGKSTGPRRPDETERLSLYRRQACRAYPVLTRFMADHMMFNAQIDAGQQLAPVIAAELGLEEREVRVLNGLSWQKIQRRPYIELPQVITAAKTGLHLQRFNRASFGHGAEISEISSRTGLDIRDVAAKLSPLLIGRGADVNRKLNRVIDAIDMLQFVARRLHAPAAMIALKRREKPVSDRALSDVPEERVVRAGREPDTDGLVTQMTGKLFLGLGLKDLHAHSDRWHHTLPAHHERIEEFSPDSAWTEMLPEQHLGGGITARELTGTAMLSRQGKREQHCVGGYGRTVLGSDSRNFTQIWSMEREGRVIGTLEVRGRSKSTDGEAPAFSCSIAQLRGKRNAPVDQECGDAAAALVKRIESACPEHLGSWLGAIHRAERQNHALHALPASIRQAGYDYWAPGGFERVWEELCVYLPRAVRKAGPEAFIASMDGMLTMPEHRISVRIQPVTEWVDFHARPGSKLTLCQEGLDPEVEAEILRIQEHQPIALMPFWDVARCQIDAARGGNGEGPLSYSVLRDEIEAHLHSCSNILKIDRGGNFNPPALKSSSATSMEALPDAHELEYLDDEMPF